MMTFEIEKEIITEHKIIRGFSARNVVAVAICFTIGLGIKLFTGLSFDILIPVFMGLAGIAFYFGWYKPSGMNAEDLIYKKILQFVFDNKTRNYKTMNKYIQGYNKAYNKIKRADLADKKIANQIKKAEKAKTNKKSKLKAIA